jgi:membrane protein
VLLGVGLFILYWYQPKRPDSRSVVAVLIGTVFAAGTWLAATRLFTLYVDNFGRYNVVYGSLGAIVVYMIFLWMTGLLVLLGGEVVAEIEARRSHGREQPGP